MHHELTLVLNYLLMHFPPPPECVLLESGIVEHLMGPGSLLGTKDTEVRPSRQASSKTWVEFAISKVLQLSMLSIVP